MAKGSIVVSLRSKGLPSFNKAVFLDFRYQAVQFATEFLDIFFSVLVTFSTLSWTAWIGVGVHIVSLAGTLAAGTFGNATIELMFPFFVYVLLPLLIFMAVIFMRRERALKHIADLKSIFVALLLSRPQGSTQAQRDLSDELHRKAVAYIEDLHKYLQHRRPYARHFYLPYRTNNPSPTDELVGAPQTPSCARGARLVSTAHNTHSVRQSARAGVRSKRGLVSMTRQTHLAAQHARERHQLLSPRLGILLDAHNQRQHNSDSNGLCAPLLQRTPSPPP